MRFKTLINRETEEFIVIVHLGEDVKPELGICSTPTLLPMTATKAGFDYLYKGELNLDGIDLIEVELKIIE